MLTDILSTAFDNADVWLYISDFNTGEILFTNKKYQKFTGQTAEDLLGKKCWSLLNTDRDCRCEFCPYQKIVDAYGCPSGKYVWELYIPDVNMWIKVVNEAIYWIDGRLANIATFYDITELKLTQAQLSDLAFVDQPLRLKNRLKFTQDMLEVSPKPTLIAFDILSLHKINEAYGRDIGDNLLISVRDWIFSRNIPGSQFYRIGGDEFCLSIGQAALESAIHYAKVLLHRFTEPWYVDKNMKNMDFLCGAAIGVIPGEYITENDSLLTLIERTLKEAKAGEKIVVYDEQIRTKSKRHVELELSLKRCVGEGMTGFDVYYQPIVNPTDGAWRGLEALCRWNSPDLGQVSPIMFIPHAERLTLIRIIGMWVLETAVRKCKEWGLDKRDYFVLNVNLSAIQFLDELLAQKILAILSDRDYPGEKLSVEITESTQFTFNAQSLETIKLLRANNVSVALDDFGTGYSNFNNLKSLPVDILKIERAFVSNIENDSYQQYLLHMMVELAHTVNMKLVAEGVENEKQRKILQNIGADFLQGYLFSKPLPPDRLEKQLDTFI